MTNRKILYGYQIVHGDLVPADSTPDCRYRV